MPEQRYYSNIYWHFTGSPKGIDWTRVRTPRDIPAQGPVLPATDAHATLKKILDSHRLLATCSERIVEGLNTEKFCCVTDIPIKDLPTHAPYYGKVAVGFRAAAVHRSFLPVMYVPTDSLPTVTRLVPNRALVKMAYDRFAYPGSFQEQQGYRLLSQAQAQANMESILEVNSEAIRGFFMNFVKITAFDPSPEGTFYREREWRNIGDFLFEPDDVAAIVVPEALIPATLSHLDERGYPKSISVIAWEFVEQA